MVFMWRNLGDTMWNPDTGVSYLPGWVSVAREMLSVAPAGAGVLAAVAGLALRGRWLRYLEIGLWLLTLGSFVYMARVLAPFTGLGLLCPSADLAVYPILVLHGGTVSSSARGWLERQLTAAGRD